MFFVNANDIREKMNEKGVEKSPFLFGVNFELTEGFFIENPLEQQEIYFQIKGIGNKCKIKFNTSLNPSRINAFPADYGIYKEGFDIVHNALQRGDSYLVNYTLKTPVECSLSLEEIFVKSDSPYQLLYPGKFVCFSPERFVYIRDNRILANPMKGTINASIPNAEKNILNNLKETAEHNTIVDLLRNDLGMVAENVKVSRFRYIDRIETQQKTILQVSSEIEGSISEEYSDRLGDIVFKLLPAGSVSGAPKPSTLQIIREAEQEKRGYYTGVFGYFDGESLDTAVLIRFIEQADNRLFFRSGGGITAKSNCREEYQEVIEKIYLPFV